MAHRSTQRRILATNADSKKTTLPSNPNPNPKPQQQQPSNSILIRKHKQQQSSSDLLIPNNNKYLSKSLDSFQTHKIRTQNQKPISQKAFFSLVGFSSDKVPKRREEEKEEKKEELGIEKRKSVSSSSSSSSSSRRSVGGGTHNSYHLHVAELGDVLAGNGVKVISADMAPFMQIHAVELARKVHDSLEKFTSKTLASTLKKEFDGIYGPAWHCIVGTSFGSFVTHSVGGFLYFSMDQKLYILLFKTTVQRAD